MTTIAITDILIVVIHSPSDIVVVWKYLGVLEMNLIVIAGAIFIKTSHHPYILLPFF